MGRREDILKGLGREEILQRQLDQSKEEIKAKKRAVISQEVRLGEALARLLLRGIALGVGIMSVRCAESGQSPGTEGLLADDGQEPDAEARGASEEPRFGVTQDSTEIRPGHRGAYATAATPGADDVAVWQFDCHV